MASLVVQHCTLSAPSTSRSPTSFQKSSATGLFILPWMLALANKRITVQLYKERTACAVQHSRPAGSIFAAFSFFSASVIRIIRTKPLRILLLLSVKLTRELTRFTTFWPDRELKKVTNHCPVPGIRTRGSYFTRDST